MPNNQFINLEELSKTTQALLSKINEQSNLKVNKNNVKSELETGTKIGSIEGIEFYAPEVDTSNFLTYDNLNLANVAFSGNYNDLYNQPTLATVATTGSYNDLKNQPSLATVATSGLYVDIQNSPNIPIVDIDSSKRQIVSSLFYPTSDYPTFLLHNISPISFNYSITISFQHSVKNLNISIYDSAGKPISSGTIPNGYHYVTDYTVTTGTNNSAIMYLNTQAYNSITVSGHTVATNVPVNAKFTDTIYDDTALANRVTALENAGYITSYTETDPTVPEWAKQANKPTYTAAEVGALPDTTVIPAAQVQSDWNATSGMGVILNKPTIPAATTVTQTLTSGTKIGEVNGVSLYAPEAGNAGIATETDPIFSASPAADITTENITAWNAKSDFSGSYNDLSDKPTIPTIPTNVSAFTNDSGYLTSYTETDPTVPAWAKAESKPTYTAQEVGALPNDTIIPTVPTNVSAFTNDAGYLTSYTETDPTVPAWAKASTKPTYTATEVGAAASSHVHGNVKNDGTITVNTSMANGDRLLFSDASDSSKIKNTSITIGTSTTQYLANNGTWQNLPTVSVSQTLTSGTEIGSVNNTKLYAPTPYDDSALAARVTALEQLEWATYYSGRSNPSSSQGQNGDIYLQY